MIFINIYVCISSNIFFKIIHHFFFYLDYYCQALRLQILFEQVIYDFIFNKIISFAFIKAHRIRNQGAKQKDLLISGYTSCKSFNIEYWKDYCTIINTNQPRKQVPNAKIFGI